MQLSQSLSSAVAQIKVSNSPMTNHTKKILPQRPPPFFFFRFLYNLKLNFLQIVLIGEDFPAFFCLWLLLLEKDFDGLIDVFPL